MNQFLNFIEATQYQTLIAIALGGLALLSAMVWLALFNLYRRSFRKALQRAVETPVGAREWFRDRFSYGMILRSSDLVEDFAGKHGLDVVAVTGIDEIWIEELKRRKRKKEFQRVIRFAPERGLFSCFLAALEREELAALLTDWLKQQGGFLPLRRLALSSAGEAFDGKRAIEILKGQLDQIRELAGDPEWVVRLFVVNTLMNDDGGEERSHRIVREALRDPRPELRKFVVEKISRAEREWLYGELFRAYLGDPVFDIRRLARDRIEREFPELYRINAEDLKNEEILHALELLRPGVAEDEAIAFHFLDGDNLEARLIAARFLDRTGTLRRLVTGVEAGDRELFERNLRLLKKALEVNVSSFFSILDDGENPAALLLCGRLLLESENRSHSVTQLARRAFAMYRRQPELADLYNSVLKCIAARGNTDTFTLLEAELLKWEGDSDMMRTLLSALPVVAGETLRLTLLRFLLNPVFCAPDELERFLTTLPPTLMLADILDIVKAEQVAFPVTVRKRALRILAGLKLPYCLQSVLEQLPILDPHDIEELVTTIAGYPAETLDLWIGRYLSMEDARVRAALILALPALREKKYIKEIRNALKDSDPEVRIAAVRSLVVLKDAETLGEESPVLRDPVERVRAESARILGANASEKIVKKFRALIEDEEESQAVRTAAVQGLGHSPHTASLEILASLLEQTHDDTPFREALLHALALKSDRKELKTLIEIFKDATPRLREDLTHSFRLMGDTGAVAMKDLLQEDIPSLKPFIIEVLDKSGSIESHIRLLRHRDPAIRRDAARFLSSVSSLASFRGLVMAAQDPDEEVRILVIKALERLETEDSGVLLNELMKDPDRRVRKYTHWALERLKVKSK